MAITFDNSFIQQWSDTVHMLFQQKGSKLKPAVRVEYADAKTYNFHRLGAVDANTKAQHAEVTGLEPAHDIVPVTLTDSYAPMYIDKLDEKKTNIAFQRPFQQTQAAALGRSCDDRIIAAMDAATPTATVTAASGLTYGKVLEALEALNDNDVDPEDLFIVISPAALTDIMNEEKLTSQDYVSMRNVMTGSIESALGFNWIKSTRLSESGGVRACYAFNKQSVGLAVNQDITTEVNYIPQRVATLVNSYMSMGSVVVDPLGLVQIDVSE